MNTILQRHYLAAQRAETLSAWWPDAEHRADKRAVDCAALHVGLDAMSRIQAKRPPQAGCVASYPPIRMRRVEAACGPWTLFDHVIAASEACERAMTCNEHAAAMRAYAVARRYAKSLGRG